MKTAKLTRAEAERLAFDILARARSGEDFDKLVDEFSEDEGKTPYTMTNAGVPPARGEMSRDGMVRSFGDVSFGLEVGQVGIAEYDPVKSEFGYHVIKRVK